MWLMVPRGFYSAVQKHGDVKDDMLTVRARCRADLDRLADLLPENVKPFREEGYTDYPWRIRLPHVKWDEIVRVLSSEINYSNFKDEVKHQNPARASVYSEVWGRLLRVEDEEPGLRKSWSSSTNSYKTGGYDDYDLDAELNEAYDTGGTLPGTGGTGYGGSVSASETPRLSPSQPRLFRDLDSGMRTQSGKRNGNAPKRRRKS
jgi:hypothetical protein